MQGDPSLKLQNNLPWCLAPFVCLFHNVNITSPCCEFTNMSSGTEKAIDPELFFNSDIMKNIRRSFMNFNYDTLPDTCKICLNSPTSNSKFYTEGRDNFADIYLNHKHLYQEDGSIEKFPLAYLSIGVSNKCNAACRMCFPVTSSSRLELLEKTGLISYTTNPDVSLTFNGTEVSLDIQHIINLIHNHKDTLLDVNITGGDPSQAESITLLFDTLLLYKDKIRITLISNGTFDRLPDGRLIWEVLDQFYKSDVLFSIDSIPEVNDYIRIGLKTRRTLKLVLECKEYFKNSPNRSVGILSTLSNYSIYYFTDFLDWINNNTWNKGIWLSMNIVNRPIYQSPHNLPPELREATLKKLCEYRTDNERFNLLIQQAKKSVTRYHFSQSDWNTCLWMDRKQDITTGMSFPLFKPYLNNIIEITDWNGDFLNNKILKR